MSALAWSGDPPPSAGWWWIRADAPVERILPQIHWVAGPTDELVTVMAEAARVGAYVVEWAGPIPEPVEKEAEA